MGGEVPEMTTFTTEDRINSDEANIFQKMMSLAIKNDSLEKELRLTKDLISKGVLDSHSYILGFNDGKQSSRDEIEALKNEVAFLRFIKYEK